MSSDKTNDTVQHLLTQADEAAKVNSLKKASNLLREAFQLHPEDPDIQKRWRNLQVQESSDHVLEPLRLYVQDGRAADGKKALQALQSSQLSSEDVTAVFVLLQQAASNLALLDALTGALLSRHQGARRYVAAKLATNATDIFEQLFHRGDQSTQAFPSVLYEDNLWPSRDTQRTAQQDLFRLCVADLMDVGIEHPERSMRAIARQLATSVDAVQALLDEDVFDVVLLALDIRGNIALRQQALIATAKMLEVTKDLGENIFSKFVTTKVARQSIEDLILAFSAAAAAFPIVPAVTARLFMTDGFVQQLVPNLEKNSEAAVSGKRKSRHLEEAALELLSAACVDKSCREAIYRYCTHWLKTLSEEREGVHQSLATLVLAKIDLSSTTELSSKLATLALAGDGGSQEAIEGLAYVSLQPKVKDEIVQNTALLKRLVGALKDEHNTVFGCLTVFSNLTAYRVAQTEEHKKMTQLKAYANQSKPASEDPLDDDDKVTARCKKLIELDIVPSLVTCYQTTRSPTNVTLVLRILQALSKDQKHRPKMVQQGAVKLLLQIRERVSAADKSSSDATAMQRTAAHALARLLISVNPAHVFSAAVPASSAVAALEPLLDQDPDSDDRDLLPSFEALLALTNLASTDDNSIRELQLRLAWPRVEDLLFSPTMLVQRASAELVCNLMVSPTCVAKFADGSPAAKRRVTILLALADVEDLATRRAAGGALAMLTEWDAAVTAVLDAKEGRGVKVLLGMCEDESDELRHRGFACLANVVHAPGDAGRRGITALQASEGQKRIGAALRRTRDGEVLRLGVEVLKTLT